LGGKRIPERLLSGVGPKIACGCGFNGVTLRIALEAEEIGVWTELLIITQSRSYVVLPIQKPVVSEVDKKYHGKGGHESQGRKS
jgi:hypothetical protein